LYRRFFARRFSTICSFESSWLLGIIGKSTHKDDGELDTLHVGELGAVTNIGEARVGTADGMASMFSVLIHESSFFVIPLTDMVSSTHSNSAR
jgi:hypothetical protein